MTPKQEQYRKKLLRAIHLHPRYAELKRVDAWESWLEVRFGVDSSAQLSLLEMQVVLKILDGTLKDDVEFTPDTAGRKALYAPTQERLVSARQQAHIVRLWEYRSRNKDMLSLMRFVRKATGQYYMHLENLTKQDATKVILAIQNL